MLKKETSINNEKIISFVLFPKILVKLFVGRNPPEEINVIDKLKELKVLNSNIFKIKKIAKVNET